jgi:hypothetical protein
MADPLEEELAVQSTAHWLLGDQDAALQTLLKLENVCPDNLKVEE